MTIQFFSGQVKGLRGPAGGTGPASGPLGAGSVTAATLSDDATEREAIRDKLGVSREKLTADRTYYVRTTGDDGNDGLANTSGGAFATLQKAADVVYGTLDLNGYAVTIQVANGTHNTGLAVTRPQVGAGNIYILGNVGAPASCLVSTSGADCFSFSNGAVAWIRGFKVTTSGSGAGIAAYLGANLNVQAIDFGDCVGSHIEAGSNAIITIDGAYTISGGAASHWHTGSPALINAGSFTVAIPNSISFTAYFAGTRGGQIDVRFVTFDHPERVSGAKYVVHQLGRLEASPGLADPIPGTAPGRVATGGIYSASQVVPVDYSPDFPVNSSIRFGAFDTATGLFKPVLVLTSVPGGAATFQFPTDGCFSSGQTHFAGDEVVEVGSGTKDGWSFFSKSQVAAGGSVFHASASGVPVGYMRRRSSDGLVLGFLRDTTSVGGISVTATGTTYGTGSDYRLKDEIEDLTGSGEFIDALRPRAWLWEVDGERGVGFIAHELQEVSPCSVVGEKDGEAMQTAAPASPEMMAHIVAELQSLRRRMSAAEQA